jgi:hypothetical protein
MSAFPDRHSLPAPRFAFEFLFQWGSVLTMDAINLVGELVEAPAET